MNSQQLSIVPRSLRRRHIVTSMAALALSPSLASQGLASHSVRIGVVDLAPWVIPNARGGAGGIFIDLLRDLAFESDAKLVPIVVPFARARAMLISSEVDMMFAYDSNQLQRIAPPLASLGEDDLLLVGRRNIRFQTLAELSGRTVGHLRGAEYDPALYIEPDITRYETNNYEQGLHMLMLNRIDAFVIPGAALPCSLKRLSVTRAEMGSIAVIKKSGLSLYVSKSVNDAGLKNRINHACEQLRVKQRLRSFIKLYST